MSKAGWWQREPRDRRRHGARPSRAPIHRLLNTPLALESLENRLLLACDNGEVCVRFEFVDQNAPGVPLQSLQAGNDFLMRVFIQDARGADAFGIFQAYFDMTYNASLVSPAGEITHGPQYDVRALGDASNPGMLNAVGGTTDGLPMPPGGSFLLFSMPFHANAEGTFTIAAQPDNNGNNQVEFIDRIGPVTDIDYEGGSIDIIGAQIRVTPTAGLVTTEAGGTATFQIALSRAPTTDVRITLSSSDTSEGTVAPGSVTFTPSNWQTPQTVTVSGVDDLVDDGNLGYTIVTAPAVSGDSEYNGLNAADVQVTNTDNDTAGIQVTPNSALTTTEAGGTATFDIVLTSQPTANVTMGLSSSDPGEGTVSPSSVTFTPSNWQTRQTVTVTGKDDVLVDGDVSYVILTSPASSGDPNYQGRDASDVSLRNLDNDVAGIVVSPTSGLTTAESGGTATFQIVLSSQPTANVSIGLSSSDASEGAVSTGTVTFTPTNWSSPQTVTVAGRDDDIMDGNVAYTIVTAPAISTDPNYSGVNAADVAVINVDNDAAGILVTSATGLTTSEGGGTAVFEIVLTSRPTADVAIALSSSDVTEGTLSVSVVTFTPANWNVSQTVTVTGQDDALSDGDIAYRIITAPAVSSDPNYSGRDPDDVLLRNTDNDRPGITVTPAAGLVTTERGDTASFQIVLNAQPTANVTIRLSSSDASEGTLAISSVTFTPADWQTPQTVIVTGRDDDLDDGDVAFRIITNPAASNDANYSGLNAEDVTVTNRDNDQAGITITPTSGLTTSEGGGIASFEILLASQPTANVTVGLSSSDPREGTVNIASVTFTPGNWNVVQTVTVTGQDDPIDDGDTGYMIITAAAVSSDIVYKGFNPHDVSLTNVDDDEAGIVVTPTSGLLTSEAGGSATFQISLTSQPLADVRIGLTSSDSSEGTVHPAAVIFTTANWNTPQAVTVTGADDDQQDGLVAYMIITAAAVSSDPKYGDLDPVDVALGNTDDDVPGVTVSRTTGLLTTEAGGSASFAVVLNTRPMSSVTIEVTSTDPSEGTVTPAVVAFSPVDWNVPQMVTIVGVDDHVDDGDVAYSIVLAPAVSDDVDYGGLDPEDVSVTNTNDDRAGIELTPSGFRTTEVGGSVMLELVLTSEPIADVTIALASSDTSEGVLSTSSATFTPANWNVPQTVTVTGLDDDVVDGNRRYRVTSAATSADPKYNGWNDNGVPIENIDDDTATLHLSAIDTRQVEGTGDAATLFAFEVTLAGNVEDGFAVAYATDDQSAQGADGDYLDNDGMLAFIGTSGETRMILVQVNQDSKVEGDEAFRVSLGALLNIDSTAAANIVVEGSPATVTIVNDDTSTVTIDSLSAPEGTDSASTGFAFRVTLSNAVQGGLGVDYTTNDGTASLADNDYVDNDGTIAFQGAEGEVQVITVRVIADSKVERDESFSVVLGQISDLIEPSMADSIRVIDQRVAGNITNDDTARVAFARDLSVASEASGRHTVKVLLTVTNGGTLSEPVTVNVVDLLDGTAGNVADYTLDTHAVTFESGSGDGATRLVQLTVAIDEVVEADETIALSLDLVGDGIGGQVTNDAEAEHLVILTEDPMTATLSGVVWFDRNNNGQLESGELRLPGVTVTLTGQDVWGQSVELVAMTDANGNYQFSGLAAGTYVVSQTQPDTYVDGLDILGTVAGVANGAVGEDQFSGIVLGRADDGRDYNFGERALKGGFRSKRFYLSSTAWVSSRADFNPLQPIAVRSPSQANSPAPVAPPAALPAAEPRPANPARSSAMPIGARVESAGEPPAYSAPAGGGRSDPRPAASSSAAAATRMPLNSVDAVMAASAWHALRTPASQPRFDTVGPGRAGVAAGQGESPPCPGGYYLAGHGWPGGYGEGRVLEAGRCAIRQCGPAGQRAIREAGTAVDAGPEVIDQVLAAREARLGT